MQATRARVGDTVRLSTPDNPRLDGATAKVIRLENWGAHVEVSEAASGQYRAGWGEMLQANGSVPSTNGMPPSQASYPVYTGEVCQTCQGSRVRMSGTCSLCDDCGSTTGCG